ncbi:MAG: 4-alpha-glucanotransferase [Proteobacteria bacterium]|nr:4-alpha-glucanotransferase [Pseudomonadota bacterium]MBU4295084.1 4-alpha-glucanotransferase [Pseudomonadota bacterium]MCG2746564.1 4-alpha-glucanotransferase [Desulfobulbaceae bacterium]
MGAQINSGTLQAKVDDALRILGIGNFLLGMHDAAFPSLPEEDIGRGSPYSKGAAEFLAFARGIGFNGIQLGPQGITTPANPSPYDGTLFSRNPLSLAPLRLSESPWNLLAADKLASLKDQRPLPASRVHGAFAAKSIEFIMAETQGRHTDFAAPRQDLFAAFRQRNADWLERDAFYEILRRRYDGRNWRHWGDDEQARLDKSLFAPQSGLEQAARKRMTNLRKLHQTEIEEYCFIQFLLAELHREFRQKCRLLGLTLFGDCQIGMSGRDAWYAQSFLLHNYVMGAPPSRTNPSGQAWNYPLLDPRQYYLSDRHGKLRPGPAIRFFRSRIDKLFGEFDALRIDHPHGLICPWVYRAGQRDPIQAVQTGARLFASPDLKDHPDLTPFAIPRPEQLNPGAKRYDDGWVQHLESEQIDRYATLFEEVMESARTNCRGACEIACEILSTQPYPIRKVMERYGLGRFRVTEKADLDNPQDVYRGENACPEDWLMLGNHDTPSIWQTAAKWIRSGSAGRQAAYLAERLRIPDRQRTRWIERTAADAGSLAQAKFADLFVGPGKNIMVFFTDLLGIEEAYNIPGTVDGNNWSLRIEPDYQHRYLEMANRGCALHIPSALAMALRAGREEAGSSHEDLIRELDSPP